MSVKGLPVVIQLGRNDLPAMREHLFRLDDIDRTQRFAQPAADEVIDRYLGRIEFERDRHFGVYLDTMESRPLVGLCHLAISRQGTTAEIGVSVDANQRRRGIAGALLERAALYAGNCGVADVIMYFLPYNTGLMELARQHGMRVSVGNGEGIARLSAPPLTPLTMAAEWMASAGALAERSLQHLAEGTCETSATWRRAVADEIERG